MRVLLFALVVGRALDCQGEQLPLKSYMAADGLAHNSVNRIVRDSYGFIWFCTSEGVSRFDGYEFHNYRRRDGLSHRDVHDLIETRAGDYWMGTAGGLCRFRAGAGRKKFQTYPIPESDGASYVNALLEDKSGRVWCGTHGGLFRVEDERGGGSVLRRVALGPEGGTSEDRIVSALIEDYLGNIWIGAGSGLYQLRADGQMTRYTKREGLPHNFITTLLEDGQRRIWAGTRAGLCQLAALPTNGRRSIERVFRANDGIGADYIQALHQLADGSLWVGTPQGLSVLRQASKSAKQGFQTYTTSEGLKELSVTALASDIAGNLWIGTDGGGAGKISTKGFVTYTRADGLAGAKVDSIFEYNGALCAVTQQWGSSLFLNEFDGKRFRATRVNLPRDTALVNWGPRSQSVALDEKGNWWFGTSGGLLRFGKTSRIAELSRKRPEATFTFQAERSSSVVAAVFAGNGEIWASTTGDRNEVFRWDRTSDSFRPWSESDAIPARQIGGVSLFSAVQGTLWMGVLQFRPGQFQLARLHANHFQMVGDRAEAFGGIRALYMDRRKRLWVGTNQNGLIRIDNPDADQPTFTSKTTVSGLSSDLILSLTGDAYGRIYIGTGAGVDRLDPEGGQIKHYTTADGLAAGEIQEAFCDHSGTLWFGTSTGLSRLTPEAEPLPSAPPIRITSLVAGGAPERVSEMGQTELSGLRYPSRRNHIQVDFVGLGFEPGEGLRYQYKLEGADRGWTEPVSHRSVNYASLGPGTYRFLVRAVNSAGLASEPPASVSFAILPPFWLQWWFQLSIIAGTGATIYWVHFYRVARLLELERVRSRIASDLHDDVGSSLSQIAILSEMAFRQINGAQQKLEEVLASIGSISRELVDSMSDIIWAVDPEQDQLRDLAHRMRRFAGDVFSQNNVEFEFLAPPENQEFQLGADVRRQVYLIFKEAVHNIVRHSGATRTRIEFCLTGKRLILIVKDNGRGFDAPRAGEGHGLNSMRARAKELGGDLEISSGGPGTEIHFGVRVGGKPGKRHKPGGH